MATKLVLIVDDNEAVATSLVIAFAKLQNVETLVAHDPASAVRMFSNGFDGRTVAAIVTDFNLPHFNGLELINQIRAFEQYRSLPVIMITADDNNPLAANGCMLNTPNAIFRKPFSIREVCRVLEELLA